MTPHTPGPWEAREVPAMRCIIIAPTRQMHGHAWVATPTDRPEGLTDRERANALLIAAAPDLLRLLDALIPLAESRAEDMTDSADDLRQQGDPAHADEQSLADEAWKAVEESRALRARITSTLAPCSV